MEPRQEFHHSFAKNRERCGGTAAGLEKIRARLLDLTNRNRLLNFRHTSASSIRIVDADLNVVFAWLLNGEEVPRRPVPEPARLLHLDRMGTVAARKEADFIVLDANPLDDIANTRRIASVHLRGQRLDRNALRARCRAPTGKK